MITEAEIAWMAGLLEGEGHFRYDPKSTHRVMLRMNDRDVVDHFGALVRKITGKQPNVTSDVRKNIKHNETFVIQLNGDSARAIMKTILPYMGFRRRKRIWQSLNRYVEPKKTTLAKAGFVMPKLKVVA